MKHIKQQLFSATAAFLFFSAAIISLTYIKQNEEALSSRIAPEILRFHVLANSDSSEDQELKLEVKQLLIKTMYSDLKAEPAYKSFRHSDASELPFSSI